MANGGSRLKTGAEKPHPQTTPAARRVFRPTGLRFPYLSGKSPFFDKHSAAISDGEFVHCESKGFLVSLASEVVHQISLYPDRGGTVG